MKKKLIRKWMMGKMMLICLTCLIGVPPSMAQGSESDKIEQAKQLFSVQFSSSTDEQRNIINFYNQCSVQQKEAILTYMVQAITDSLKTDNKQFAMNYIDYYRLIASPDNEYLGSLVVTEGKYYYDLTNATKLSELSDYITGIAVKSKLDYSDEIAELETMKDILLNGYDNMLGYWCVDDYGQGSLTGPILYMKVEKNNNQLIVSLSTPSFNFYIYNKHQNPEYQRRMKQLSLDYENKIIKSEEDFIIQMEKIDSEFGSVYKDYFELKGELSSLECIQSSPNSLSFFGASQKIKKGNEYLATGLRSGVRTISNDIIGELARSNTHSFGTTLFGSLGTIFGEAVLNGLIDGISTSKNTIRTISGTLTLTGKGSMDANIYVDYFHASTEDSIIETDSTECKINFIRYDLNDPYIYNNIIFFDLENEKYVRYDYLSNKYDYLSNKEEKAHLLRHPEAKIKKSSLDEEYYENVINYNKEQYAKLKEYNRTH